MHQKNSFRPCFAPDPDGGTYDAPPGPLVGWVGDTFPLRRLDLGAYAASISDPPKSQLLNSFRRRYAEMGVTGSPQIPREFRGMSTLAAI